MPDKPSITIIDVREEIEQQTKERFKHHINLIYAVLIIVGLGFITVIIAVF